MFLCLLTVCLLSVGIKGSRQVLVKVFVSVLRPETENRTLLLTAAGGVQEVRREWAVELVGVGLPEFFRHPVPHFAVPFKSSARKLAKNLFEGRHYKNDVLQNQSTRIYSKTDQGFERKFSLFWTPAEG